MEIQIQELTSEEVELPKTLQELKVDGSLLETNFNVHITPIPKGISIFGTPGAIEQCRSALGDKIGDKTMRVEVQPSFTAGKDK